jgi:Restriction endonuclease
MEFFVGGLPYAITAPRLSAFVEEVVEPDATLLVTDQETERSKGFGFFEVSHDSLAKITPPIDEDHDERDRESDEFDGPSELIRQLSEKELLDRKQIINVAKPPRGFAHYRSMLGSPSVRPDEEAFRDGLEATLKHRSVEGAIEPSALDSVRAELGKITFVDSRLVEYLADHRERLHTLITPRQFEELCFELLARTGFHDLVLTSQSRDGGVDLLATRVEDRASRIYVVECKLWQPENRVGGPVIQQTFGVMGLRDADRAMIVTSSDFTGPAKDAQASSSGKIVLRNRHALGAWIGACRAGEPDGMLWLPGDPAVAPTVSHRAPDSEVALDQDTIERLPHTA